MRLMTWAGLIGVLTLVSTVGEAAPPLAGNFYTRIGANDAPVGGRFSIYVYMLDSLDAAVETPGPGRIMAVNFRGSNGKNAFVVPGDLVVQGTRKGKWKHGFFPVSEEGLAGLLDEDDSRWALWWIPRDSLVWKGPADLKVHYGFSSSQFVPLSDKDAATTLRALPWDRIGQVTVNADRPTSRLDRAPNPAAFDKAPRVRTRKTPVYPKSSRVYDFEGSVHVVAHVTDTGSVSDAYIIQSSAIHDLNVAALVAVMDWTFRPGKNAPTMINTAPPANKAKPTSSRQLPRGANSAVPPTMFEKKLSAEPNTMSHTTKTPPMKFNTMPGCFRVIEPLDLTCFPLSISM